MKRVLLKAALVLTVLSLGVILMVLALLVLDNDRGDRLPLAIIGLCVCLFIADRSISSLFRLARLTDERWSVFKSPGQY